MPIIIYYYRYYNKYIDKCNKILLTKKTITINVIIYVMWTLILLKWYLFSNLIRRIIFVYDIINYLTNN